MGILPVDIVINVEIHHASSMEPIIIIQFNSGRTCGTASNSFSRLQSDNCSVFPSVKLISSLNKVTRLGAERTTITTQSLRASSLEMDTRMLGPTDVFNHDETK